METIGLRNDANGCHFHSKDGDASGKALLINGNYHHYAVQISVGLVEHTLSGVEDIENDLAVWEEWPAGVVSATTSHSLYSMATAIKYTGVGSFNVVGGSA